MRQPLPKPDETALRVGRVVAAAAAGIAGVVLTVGLIIGIDSRPWRILALLGASLAAAIVVVLLPASWRTRLGLLFTAFITAAGFLPVLINSDGEVTETQKKVNAQYLADLIRKGPFTETLPDGIKVVAIEDVKLSDVSASGRIDAVSLKTSAPGDYGNPYTVIETYPSPEAAAGRARAYLDDIKTRYENSGISQDQDSFCVSVETGLDGTWICGRARGHVFVQTTVSPYPNSLLPVATGTMSAAIRYADRLAVLASAP
jgi:hypothetical protein